MTIIIYLIGILTGVFSTYLAWILYRTFKTEPVSPTTSDAAYRQIMKY